MNTTSKHKGDYGEGVAEGYLAAKGYTILAQNFKKNGNEIDIVAEDGGYIVFVEVKYRRGTSFGSGLEAITPAKARRIFRAAKAYLYDNNKWDAPCRFDIIEIFGSEELEVNHFENAFWER